MKLVLIFKNIIICILVPLLVIPIIVISIILKFDSKGPIIYWSKRVGLNNKIF